MRHRFGRRVAPELREELAREPNWMYRWSLPKRHQLKLLNPELNSVHTTRAEMIEPAVRAALARSSSATAIDLACSEGWFAHRLLEWGAQRVIGLDIREQNIHRARLMRAHFEIPPERLELRTANLYDLPLFTEEQYDVVLLLGLVYHVEDPVGAFRRARALTRDLMVVESQLTRQVAPIVHGWGTSDSAEEAPGSFATRMELDAELNPVASSGGVLSLVPNRVALEQMAIVAGFSRTEILAASPHHNQQYVAGDRAVMLAWA
jgi:tRNA (mo5U34)-methyltransferase